MSEADERQLDTLLEQLEEEERDLSFRRRKLHERLAIFPESPSDIDLAAREAEISRQRRELHQRIDELRAERNRLRGRDADQT
jgi:chromosome segregation ATPase